MRKLVTVKKSDGQWSKAEELEILREFMSQLQPDSYLKSILEGMDGYVEQQIRSDMGLSIIGDLEQTRAKLMKADADLNMVLGERDRLQDRLNAMAEDMFKLQQEATRLQDEHARQIQQAIDGLVTRDNQCRQLSLDLKRREDEILVLKARLYDLTERVKTLEQLLQEKQGGAA